MIQQLFLLLVVLELLILIMMQIILVKKSIELAIPLKYLGNFWRALNMLLISCEVSLELKWNKNCIITSQQIEVNLDGGNTAAPTDAILAINDCKLYIPVVTFSKDDEIKLLTNLKSDLDLQEK